MTRTAIYARYSCDQQRETSIDDQIRRCREVAARNGLTVDDKLIFTDSALSGRADALDRRDGYQNFLAAWEAGHIDVFIVDEFSRLSRDAIEQARIMDRLEKNRRVRMVTAAGIDTTQPDWQLRLGLQGVLAQQESRTTRDRVGRGMVGQLERGYMVAPPPIGYVLDRQFDSIGNRIGTHWKIHEGNAAIVREIFERRGAGQSMHQIAKWLNETRIPLQRQSKSPEEACWRPSRVRCILQNPIYRGEFVWNGSSRIQAEAKKTGHTLDVRVFARPQLRIVSDELWYRCNTRSISRSGYGSGKHALAGIFTCGCCGSVLVLSSQERCRSLYCAKCTVAKAVAGKSERLSVTVAVAGAQQLLLEAMRNFLTEQFITQFHSRLRDMLTGDHRHEIDQIENELSRLKSAQIRLSKLMTIEGDDDTVLQDRYIETKENIRRAEARLAELRKGMSAVQEAAIQAQLQADPAEILEGVFQEDVPPEKLRSILARLFPEIILEGKAGRYTSFFRIRFALGAALAMVSGTDTVLDETAIQRYALTYKPDNSRKRLNGWSVMKLADVSVDSSTDKTNSAPLLPHLMAAMSTGTKSVARPAV